MADERIKTLTLDMLRLVREDCDTVELEVAEIGLEVLSASYIAHWYRTHLKPHEKAVMERDDETLFAAARELEQSDKADDVNVIGLISNVWSGLGVETRRTVLTRLGVALKLC